MKGMRELAGLAQHPEADARLLVGRPLVDLAPAAEPRRDALEHEPEAHVDGLQARHLARP